MSEATPAPEGLTPIPLVRWTTDAARRFADLVTLLDDLQFVVKACERLAALIDEDDADPIVTRALWNAALVAYARCWATGVRVGLTPDLLDVLQGDPHGFHQHLLDLRDKHIAHAVNPFEDVAVGLALSPETEEHRTVVGVGYILQKLISFEHEAIEHFRMLATHIALEVERLASTAQQDVLAEGTAGDFSEIVALPPVSLTTPGPEHVTQSRRRRTQ